VLGVRISEYCESLADEAATATNERTEKNDASHREFSMCVAVCVAVVSECFACSMHLVAAHGLTLHQQLLKPCHISHDQNRLMEKLKRASQTKDLSALSSVSHLSAPRSSSQQLQTPQLAPLPKALSTPSNGIFSGCNTQVLA